MKFKILGLCLVSTLLFTGCINNTDSIDNSEATGSTDTEVQQSKDIEGEEIMKNNKELALQFVGSFSTGDSEILNHFHKDYKMHRPEYPSTMETMASFFPGEPYGMTTDNIRLFVDGDIVVTHNYTSEYPGSDPFVSIDILGFEDGQIAHYWDNMESEPIERLNNHKQYDGETEVTDLEKTDENKSLVEAYVSTVYINKNVDKVNNYIHESLTQHGTIADGRQALIDDLSANTPNYTELKKILGQGNFVLSICDALIDDQPSTFYNLYRIHNGLIVEAWEVTEVNPPKEDWKNENGRTNFN